MKRNEEVFTTEFTVGGDGYSGGLNIDLTDKGNIIRRKGYNTFGEMVDVLWNINKNLKKHGAKVQYTVMLPLKGTKPVYKKTYDRR